MTVRLSKEEQRKNAERAERASKIVNEYRRLFDANESTETAMTDLLADLKHLCRVLAGKRDPNGFLMWQALDRRAHGHFIAEVYGVEP